MNADTADLFQGSAAGAPAAGSGTALASAVFRVIDCETTGSEPPPADNPHVSGVCELGDRDVAADGQNRNSWTWLLDPGMPISASASAVHHLTDDDVAGCPKWRLIAKGHEAPVYVAHNAEFDSKFLQLPGLWLCTYRMAKHLWPELEGHGNEALRYALKLKPETVKDAASHRAVNDVAVTAAILCRALAEIRERWPHVTTCEQLAAQIAKPALLDKVPFKSAGGVRFADADYGLLTWIVNKQAGGSDCVYSARHWLRKRFGGGNVGLREEEGDDDEQW